MTVGGVETKSAIAAEQDSLAPLIPRYVVHVRGKAHYFYTFLVLVLLAHLTVFALSVLVAFTNRLPLTEISTVDLIPSEQDPNLAIDSMAGDASPDQPAPSAQAPTPSPTPPPAPVEPEVKPAEIAADQAPKRIETPVQPAPRPVPRPKPAKPVTPPQPAKAVPADRPASEPIASAPGGNPGTGTDATNRSPTGTATTVADHGPKLANATKPRYPLSALRSKQEGIVVMDIDVDVNGTVTRTELARTSGSDALDQAALSSALHWTFTPAVRAGTPVPSRIRIPIKFDLTAPE